MDNLTRALFTIVKDFSIEELLSDQEQKLKPYNPNRDSSQTITHASRFLPIRKLKIAWCGILLKTRIWEKLIYSNLKLDWFYEFKEYWEGELGGRPLNPNDFWFLYGITRLAQAEAYYLGEQEEKEPNKVLDVWRQKGISLRLLFFNTLKLALHPLIAFKYVKYFPKRARVCEYGCGLAPVTNSLVKFYPHLKLKITCADIPHLLFHYMRWRFRKYDFIECLPIRNPLDEKPLGNRKYNVIFAIEVFEHLPKPLAIIEHLHGALEDEGVLIFNYVRASGGRGLDSHVGSKERLNVLKFVQEKFRILEGEICLDGRDVKTTICRKVK